jgi:hypothetical protein
MRANMHHDLRAHFVVRQRHLERNLIRQKYLKNNDESQSLHQNNIFAQLSSDSIPDVVVGPINSIHQE